MSRAKDTKPGSFAAVSRSATSGHKIDLDLHFPKINRHTKYHNSSRGSNFTIQNADKTDQKQYRVHIFH